MCKNTKNKTSILLTIIHHIALFVIFIGGIFLGYVSLKLFGSYYEGWVGFWIFLVYSFGMWWFGGVWEYISISRRLNCTVDEFLKTLKEKAEWK